tara:strand:- start:9095 stop:9499 length:405 start_codon:yes stop_codon:yes gene_type:complete
MSEIIIKAGGFIFEAKFENNAPNTVSAFRDVMPFSGKLIHVRWSGEAVWIPLGDKSFGVDYENHTTYPSLGQVLLYPGGISETEILISYGSVNFASKMGQLAGNHFMTFTSGIENLKSLGNATLWQGSQDIEIR